MGYIENGNYKQIGMMALCGQLTRQGFKYASHTASHTWFPMCELCRCKHKAALEIKQLSLIMKPSVIEVPKITQQQNPVLFKQTVRKK